MLKFLKVLRLNVYNIKKIIMQLVKLFSQNQNFLPFILLCLIFFFFLNFENRTLDLTSYL